jgi:hypothetical protein
MCGWVYGKERKKREIVIIPYTFRPNFFPADPGKEARKKRKEVGGLDGH